MMLIWSTYVPPASRMCTCVVGMGIGDSTLLFFANVSTVMMLKTPGGCRLKPCLEVGTSMFYAHYGPPPTRPRTRRFHFEHPKMVVSWPSTGVLRHTPIQSNDSSKYLYRDPCQDPEVHHRLANMQGQKAMRANNSKYLHIYGHRSLRLFAFPIPHLS